MEASVKFHEKIYLSKDQRYGLGSRPSEGERHRREITHYSVENKDSGLNMTEVARKTYRSTTILPDRTQFNTEPPRQDINGRTGVQQTASVNRESLPWQKRSLAH